MRKLLTLGAVAIVVAPAEAQIPSAEQQIAEALAALPEQYQADATVLGYVEGRELPVTLKEGTNHFVCLGDSPTDGANFQVSCYHRDLAGFMARGRELRAEGVTGMAVRERRLAEIEAGTLTMPQRASMITVSGQRNEATGIPDEVSVRHTVYLPYATPEEVGLPDRPGAGPWVMDPGLHRAHIMISGGRREFKLAEVGN